MSCEALGCGREDADVRPCFGARFCQEHAAQLAEIRKHLQLAKKRKKIYLEFHIREHEAALRGRDEAHAFRVNAIRAVILQRQGSLDIARLYTCPLPGAGSGRCGAS
jgi:hypothetical protein